MEEGGLLLLLAICLGTRSGMKNPSEAKGGGRPSSRQIVVAKSTGCDFRVDMHAMLRSTDLIDHGV
jgi:hypothetical protein